MHNKRRIVIFDFCETLVDFQTADAYVDYVRECLKYPSIIRREKINLLFRKWKISQLAEKLTSYNYSIEKKLKLWQLKRIDRQLLEKLAFDYYQNIIKPHLIEKTLILMQKHLQQGDYVFIVSGGYGIYLRFFAEEYKVSRLISSNIEFNKEMCTGRMSGLDCMNNHKVELLKGILVQMDDVEIVASYSDSISDIPILRVAKEGYVISRHHQDWGEKNGFKEIIWT